MATLIEISDPADSRLRDYRDLRDVQLRSTMEVEHGLFIAEGAKVVRRAIEAGFEPRSFLMAPKWLDGLADILERSDAPCYVMSERQAELVTGFHVHRGALASLVRAETRSVESVIVEADQRAAALGHRRRRIAVLESLVDHANVGSVFRNAAALGVDGIVVSPRCADPLYRRAIKTSMGNVFQIPWTRATGMEDTLAALTAAGYTTVALTLSEDTIDLDDVVAQDLDAIAFIFGTEGDGVDPRTARQSDLRVKIPMEPGVDSLNVAAATAVAFFATR